MSLSQRLAEYISACFTGLWVQSFEHEDALREIAQLCREQQWRCAVWDIDRGLQVAGQPAEASGSDPLAAIRSLNALASPDSSAILILVNFHRYLGSPEIIQALAHQIATGKQNRTFCVILSAVVQVPVELEKLMLVVEHDLPNRQQIEEIARGIATQDGELPGDNDLAAVLDAASGLTRYEVENACSLSLVRHGRVTTEAIWELKSQMLKKSGLMQLHRGAENFGDLGGLAALKAFCARAMCLQSPQEPRVRPRGVLLLGVPGTGKSAFAKALGAETGRPVLLLDVGALMGSLVGSTEANIRQALRIADAMAPCVLFLDEVEKGLAGAAGSGVTDSGVTARLFGTFLTWLNDHETDVFVVATCNEISKLPPEFGRAERFDGIFFLDLPGHQQKHAIWDIYLKQFGLDAKQARPTDSSWTGAEIRACARLAALLRLPLIQAAQNVVPVAVTACEQVDRLRTWASGRCLSADYPGIYQRDASPPVKPGRKVRRDPSTN
jgi:hypothetical protein